MESRWRSFSRLKFSEKSIFDVQIYYFVSFGSIKQRRDFPVNSVLDMLRHTIVCRREFPVNVCFLGHNFVQRTFNSAGCSDLRVPKQTSRLSGSLNFRYFKGQKRRVVNSPFRLAGLNE